MSRILVVDDEPVSMDEIRLELEGQGHEVIPASNIEDTYRRLENDRVDVAILNARAVRATRVVFTYLRCAWPNIRVIAPAALAARENDRFTCSKGSFVVASTDPCSLAFRVNVALAAH